MKSKITEIINQVSNRTISTDEAIEEILRLLNVVEESEQSICPCCGSDKTYKTGAIHCNRCAITTEL